MDCVAVAEGLFRWVDDRVHLIGSKCKSCGSVYFPRSPSCRNPDCTLKQVEETLLSREGRLYSYTVQKYRPPAPFRMEPWMPYAVGLIELTGGIRVMGMLTGFDLDHIRIGTPVEVTAEALYRNEAGQQVVTYKFRRQAHGVGA
jgi:uncharacterized protein